MRFGIFAKTFNRPGMEDIFHAVQTHGLDCVQYNLSCAGLPSMPEEIDPAIITRIHNAAVSTGVEITALSGTYNMIHPNPVERESGLRRFRTLAGVCAGLGTGIITLCSGTRDPEHMWRWHPDNDSPEAWSDLLDAMASVVRIAEEKQVVVAFEPEQANVVNSAARGLALIRTIKSSHLKVVFDGANLITPDRNQRETLAEAMDLLGEHTVIAHAKDRGADGKFLPAGQGILDYGYYLQLLMTHQVGVPLVLHGLAENQVDASLRYLNNKLQEF